MLTLQKQFERHLERSRFFNSHDKLVVAVSTGVDSMVLLDLLQSVPDHRRPQLVVAHVNHELRAQSNEEERYIRQYCTVHHLPLVVKHWPQATHPQHGVENAARQFRYRFFAAVMADQRAQFLATAHHQNDLAETMLMKMTRGGDLSQLVGISDRRPFATGELVRPLLPFSKEQLHEYAIARQLKWYEDETNHELDVQRNRFRHEILPLLERENPRVREHLANYHRQLTELLAWREEAVKHQLSQVVDRNHRLKIPQFLAAPEPAQRPLLERWLNRQRVYDLKDRQLTAILQLLANEQTPQQTVELPGKFILVKDYQYCLVKDHKKLPQELQKFQPHVIELEQWYRISDTRKLAVATRESFFTDGEEVMAMWLSPDQLPLTLRRWQPADRLRLKGGGHQRVKRVLIDQKVSQQARERQLVLVDARGEVVWLLGRKWSWFARPQDFRQQWRPVVIGIKDEEEKKHE
jgi:tRNA(Ile)-lysidine synthase